MNRIEQLKDLRDESKISEHLFKEILSNEVAQKIWDFSPDLLVLHTTHEDDNPGMFIMCSQSWTTELGWSLKELTENPFTDFILEEDLEATKKVYEGVEIKDSFGYFVNRYKTKDGGFKTLMWNYNYETIDNKYSLSIARILK